MLRSYGIDVSDLGHRVADLADKILKGAFEAFRLRRTM